MSAWQNPSVFSGGSKGFPPTALQVIEQHATAFALFAGQPSKGSNQQSRQPFLVSLSTPFRSILHRINPNLSTVIGASRNGDVQAVEAFLTQLSGIPGRACAQRRGNFGE